MRNEPMQLKNHDTQAGSGQVHLLLKEETTLPVEAEGIRPDAFKSMTRSEIENLPIYRGNKTLRLKDLFKVEGEKSDQVVVQGRLEHFKKIGAGMTAGCLTVQGDVGPRLAQGMKGGRVTVLGNAGDRAGQDMSGGRIWIKGSAGHQVGGAAPGQKKGMNKGLIIVEGDAGRDLGLAMRRGLIVVLGDVGDYAGSRMIAGTILAFGNLGRRAGAGMKRGSIVALGPRPSLLPTFEFECRYQPVFLRFIIKQLKEAGLPLPIEVDCGQFSRYTGDMNTINKGEILIHETA